MTKPVRSLLWQYIPMGLAVGVMLFLGWKQGVLSERWGTSDNLRRFGEQLLDIPMQVGQWRGEDLATDKRALAMPTDDVELVRKYRNTAGDIVTISMLCSRFEDIFGHTPETCYPAAGYEIGKQTERQEFDIPGIKAQFFTTTFKKSSPTGAQLQRGFWSWSSNGDWLAPENPKLTFASQQWAMYKLYVFRAGTDVDGRGKDVCQQFIRDFLPEVNKALRPMLIESGRIQPAEPESEG